MERSQDKLREKSNSTRIAAYLAFTAAQPTPNRTQSKSLPVFSKGISK